MSDMVNQPAHYTAGGIECIDALEAATKGLEGIEAACTANAIKYLWRWKRKNGAEDLHKAIWYICRLLKRIESAAEVDEAPEELPSAPEPYVSPGAQVPQFGDGIHWTLADIEAFRKRLGVPMPEEPTPETHAEYVHKCEHEDCRRKYFTAATEFADCPNCGRKSRGEWDG